MAPSDGLPRAKHGHARKTPHHVFKQLQPLTGESHSPSPYDDTYIRTDELRHEPAQAVVCAVRIALFNHNVSAFDITHCTQASSERIKMLVIRPCLPEKAQACDCR
jgi:hypothetical protein